MAGASIFAKGNTALITGAASGVGLAVAQLCRKRGMNLALVDNNGKFLERAKKELQDDGTKTEIYEMDVSQLEQWRALEPKVTSAFDRIDLLLLNAGIQMKGGWDDADYFRKILEVNLFGVINGLNTFVPVVQAQAERSGRPSAIAITGSKQGITNPPGNPAYNASKAAIKSLAEQLSFSLRDTPTTVHLLVPGWTFTGLSGGGPDPAKEKPAGAWEPAQVAAQLERRVAEGQFWVLCPDNDVDELTDKKRMLWSAGDAVQGRLPLSRWREEYKEEAKEWMDAQKL